MNVPLNIALLNISADGIDERQDLFELPIDDPRANLARSVTALFGSMNELEDQGNGLYRCKTRFTAAEYNHQMFPLCEDEKFINQPTGALGSGVLVAPDIVATASHNLPSAAFISQTVFVFDFLMQDAQTPSPIKVENIYHGHKIIQHENILDWALVRLDRLVTEPERVCKLDSQELILGRKVYTIGCPCGLPLKLCGSAIIEEVGTGFFLAGLDAYRGNSGSPVFDAESHQVVGLVVSDTARDFDLITNAAGTSSCCKSSVVPIEEAHGDKCVRASHFAEFVQHSIAAPPSLMHVLVK